VQAATTVKAYLDAQTAGRWSEACSFLASAIRDNLDKLTKRAPNAKVEGCAEAMESILGGIPKGMLRTVADIHVLSMRVDGDRGFLIYEDRHAAPTEIPMEREGGEWKVRALIAKDLIAR
jgi:hypothetical protein